MFSKEEVNGALMLTLSGALTVLAVAKGADGPLSLGRVVSEVLSNPVPNGAAA